MENNTETLNRKNIIDVQSPTNISDIEEKPSQENIEKTQYEYLKLLNKKLTMFKKQENKNVGKLNK